METIIQKCFLKNLFLTFQEKYNNFWFLGLWKFLLKYKKVLLQGFRFPKYKNTFLLRKCKIFGRFDFLNHNKFSRGGFFCCSSLRSYFLKYKRFVRVDISSNTNNFLILKPERSISRKYKNLFRVDFLLFLELHLINSTRQSYIILLYIIILTVLNNFHQKLFWYFFKYSNKLPRT